MSDKPRLEKDIEPLVEIAVRTLEKVAVALTPERHALGHGEGIFADRRLTRSSRFDSGRVAGEHRRETVKVNEIRRESREKP